MSKSSVVVYTLLAVACGVLLFLWYALGFYVIDDPLDLVVAIVWWAIIALAVWGTIKAENARRERVRTLYVGQAQQEDGATSVPAYFNSETGLVELQNQKPQDAAYAVLNELTYDFGTKDFPDGKTFVPQFMVRTKKFHAPQDGSKHEQSFKYDRSASERITWEGEVIKPVGDDVSLRWEFATPQQLTAILANM